MPFWYLAFEHPSAGGPPWYSVDRQGRVCRADDHPRGAAAVPTFQVTDDIAYSTGYGTEGEGGIPWFTIVGSMVYRAEGHPLGKSHAPRYQSRS